VAVIDFGEAEAQSPSLTTPIAGLPLVLRILLPLRRAGVHGFFLLGPVSPEVLTVLEGDSRLRGRVHAVASLDPVRALGNGPVLIMRGLVALDREMTEDLVRRAEKDTSFFTLDPATDGTSGPSRWQGVGVVRMPNPQELSPPDDLPRLLETLRAKGRLEVHPASAEALGIVRDPADAEAWERRLFARLEAHTDHPWFQRVVNRRLSTWVTRRLVSTPLTPNQVTAASLAVGLLAAACFLPESFAWSLVGWILFQSSYILDCVDGEIARLKMQESPLGAWIDSMADTIVQAAILFVLGVRLQRSTGHWGFLALGVAGAAGILITGAVVTHYLVRDRSLRLADVRTGWIGRLGLRRLGPSLEETANRDPFAIALLAGVLFNRVDLFLWVAAVGVNVYLVLLLLLKQGTHRATVT
jgi:phosphatidylglycerophosphate synthase